MEETKKVTKPNNTDNNESTESKKDVENTKKLDNASKGDNTKKVDNASKEDSTKKSEIIGNTFGDKIIQGRKKKGMSQEAFADIMGVSRQMVSRWELNTAMPRMQKIRKISEILDISIEELLSGKLKGKDNSPVALNTINLKKLLKVIAVVLAILLILYVAYSVYKMVVLNKISSKLEQYKNLDNYYFKLESLVDGDLQETNEIWYKDGKYKMTNTTIMNSISNSTTTYLDINNGYRYIIDETNKTYLQFDLIGKESYDNGIYMYNLFPVIIKKEASDFKNLSFTPNWVFAYNRNDSLFLLINNETLEFDKNTLLPKYQFIKMHENKNSQFNENKYNIQLNILRDEDVDIPADYKKTN